MRRTARGHRLVIASSVAPSVALVLACASPAWGADAADAAPTPITPPAITPEAAEKATAATPNAPAIEEKSRSETKLDYDKKRYEPAAFPLIGGDSDIGFEFGAVSTLSKFGDGVRPYIWNMDLLVAISVKQGPSGAEITQQNYLWDIDAPGLFGGSVRINPAVSYERTVNQGYFGLGNASSGVRPADATGVVGRYFQYDARQAQVRELTRIAWQRPWDIMVATTYRFDAPDAYAGSRLAEDDAAGTIRGVENMSLVTVGVGLIYDTRDNEYFPRHGAFHQIGLRYTQSFPVSADARYAGFGAMLAKYVPIASRAVLAFRGVIDAEAGHVPFFDLYTGGPFQTYEMIGGSAAIRGVPDGRYSGPLKVFGNVELRTMAIDFRVLGQSIHIGGNLLFDIGRLWSDYTFNAATDGHGIGLKWGAGGGVYLVWGQAAVFRIEAAYSPDAVAENPHFPIGLYVEDGVMF